MAPHATGPSPDGPRPDAEAGRPASPAGICAPLVPSRTWVIPIHRATRTGPSAWGDLGEEYASCGAGLEQSPIDIVTADVVETDTPDPVLDWEPGDLKMINNGHTIEAEVPEGNATTLGGAEYELKQFHWHRPSETTIDGEGGAMELHFVSQDAAGNRAVLSVLIQEGEADPLYDTLWAAQPATESETDTIEVESFDFAALLPDDLTTWTFDGSLTTPPCTEGVSWNVLVTPTTMSAEQVDAFLYEGNARPTQPLGDRTVDEDSSTGA